ncbi:hypothetical protein MUY27_19225 [Mucilaginibacter sp. RS28]|uniref:RES domain-containing protein n=1 Tax=Mucilaginibacter straminoryzae TaxID=2932774 RepID=A0A9X2BBL7_9SPHI|nr:hypothetical protein [Mucilaginibacter straminoryzae]MCJ8211860.1 hypothetical protein [Mucilaginibacter straminoryzae]
MKRIIEMKFPAMVNNYGETPKDLQLSWVNDNLSSLQKKLETVKRLLTQPVDNARFNEAINAIYFIIDKLPLMVTRLNVGTHIFRARPNYGKLYSKKQDISYNIENVDKISAGRFNRPLEPLFYGSLRVNNPKIDPVLHCSLEACKQLKDQINPPAIQDLTIGCWINKGLLPVINLSFDEKHLAGNADLRQATDNFKAKTDKFFSPAASKFIFKFMEFFSELACSVNKDESSYFIMNAYLFAIRYYYANERNTAIPGVIYPSAMTDNHGLNMVLVPQAVDYFLELQYVYMQRFFLPKGSKTYISYPCSELIKVADEKFNFARVRPYILNGEVVDYGLTHNKYN